MKNFTDIFNKDGVVHPIKIFNDNEIDYYISLLEFEIDHNEMIEKNYRCKSLLLYKWVDEIARNDKILDLVELILGPNIFCWDTQFWIKNPNDKKYVSWHQDATYWNFKEKKGVIVWLSFSDINDKMGPVIYKLGSHLNGQYKHRDYPSPYNILTRGQTICNDDKYEESILLINKGYISIHHPYVIHGSSKNICINKRMGISLQYIPTSNNPIIGNEYATLVRGIDEYKYIINSPQATSNFNINYENWKSAFNAQRENYFKLTHE